MKLSKLELLAYGPFRGTTLDFHPRGLHVVLGRNEAGKSTTLRAITGLFYGIDAKTPDGHVFKLPDLRIGGVLENSAGETLRVVRRKGNANTLLDDKQQVIDESAMKRFLGGVTRETFQHAFGLDHDTLEAGAKALLEGRGDLGESLFDASVGGGGEVQRLVAELAAEADAIYKPRASSLPLNDALKSFAEAQKSVREKQSLPEAFIEQERGLEAAVTERTSLFATKKELETRRSRLVRARKRVPLEKRRARALERRGELGAVCQHVTRIEALQGRFGVYERLLEQRRDLALESERLDERIVEAARDAGVAGVDRKAAPSELRLDARKEARIQALLRERTTLTKQLDGAALEIARLERERDRASRAPSSSQPDEAARRANEMALASVLERARASAANHARLASETARLDRRQKDLETKLASLGGFDGTLEAFAALRVPAIETVERLGKRFDDAGRVLVRLEERRAELDRDAASLERQTATQSGELAPPDIETLQRARSARDDAWKTLRSEDEASRRRSLEVDVERLLRDVDGIADRMIREADRVTALARLRAETEANARQLEKVDEERKRVHRERTETEQALGELFAGANVAVLGFAEARRWLVGHEKICDDYRALRDTRAELVEEASRADDVKSELALVLAKAGGEVASSETLVETVANAAAQLAALETLRRDAADAERARIELQTKLDERIAVRSRDETALGELTVKLTEILSPLGIPADASADEVNRSLETLRDLFGLVDKRVDAETRARLVETDVGGYERELCAAIGELGADLGTVPVRDAATVLFTRAASAKANEQELASVLEQLEGEPETMLDEGDRALLADPDASERACDELGDRLKAIDEELTRLTERIGGVRGGLEAMRAESHAADAAAAAQEHLSRIRENAERWGRAKLASVVLAREIERYREENQGPLLTSSSALFARLTLGAFSGIRAGFDEKDKPCLRCVRSGGGEVDVAGLSDGTRDQLYLSLRLASLLRRAEMAEPMPLVLDDVLVQLDDQRAAAALGVLAEVSRRMQVLFFTHHARLVDLARASVAPNELVVHELPSARPAPEVANASA